MSATAIPLKGKIDEIAAQLQSLRERKAVAIRERDRTRPKHPERRRAQSRRQMHQS